MRRAIYSVLACAFLMLGITLLLAAQAHPAQQADDIPVTDGGSGPCSIEFFVTDGDAKPVYAARIDVHMAYGAFGAHKLDMSVYTNAQGKARFTGIPVKVRKPPIEFQAKKSDLIGVATMDPATECQAKHDIVLATTKAQ
ncbi:MAG TPA: hypothetical protein VGK24_03385 [Candidatus Angelobacter sp.]|jgi:hypothetical protein